MSNVPPNDYACVFSALDKEASSQLNIATRTFRAGNILLSQGFQATHCSLVIDGFVKMSFLNKSGREFIIGIRAAPFIVGGAEAILESPATVTATTLNTCKIRPFPVASFRQALKVSPHFGMLMNQTLAIEFLRQTADMMEANSRGTRSRLLLLLQDLYAKPEDKGHSAADAGTRVLRNHEIAKLLAITPEYLSRLLRNMQREGLLRLPQHQSPLRNAKTPKRQTGSQDLTDKSNGA